VEAAERATSGEIVVANGPNLPAALEA